MTHRTFPQLAARAVLGALAIIIGILMPTRIPVVVAVLGAQLAYDGPDRRSMLWTVGFLAVAEMLFALDLGVLSLSYLAAAGVLSLAGRLMAISPWATAGGWSIADAVRTAVVAMAVAVVIMAGSVLVGALYGNDQLVQRVSAHIDLKRMGPLALAVATVLLVMRRVDMPFRRPIHFGT